MAQQTFTESNFKTQVLSAENISFRRVQMEDLPLLHRWLNEPHVHAWYDKDEEQTFDHVSKEYLPKITGEEPTKGYIVLYDTYPVAYIQSYRAGDWPEFSHITGYGASDAGVDLFVGDPKLMGKGFGTMMIKKFLQEIIFVDPGIKKCFIDPEPNNKRAIRAYEKAGFRYVKTVQMPDEPDPSYFMEINKEEQ
ncbi:MAG: GNAT family N-acetyltransferase [Patescibacteria group bacterium]